jgi:hypothetical protein
MPTLRPICTGQRGVFEGTGWVIWPRDVARLLRQLFPALRGPRRTDCPACAADDAPLAAKRLQSPSPGAARKLGVQHRDRSAHDDLARAGRDEVLVWVGSIASVSRYAHSIPAEAKQPRRSTSAPRSRRRRPSRTTSSSGPTRCRLLSGEPSGPYAWRIWSPARAHGATASAWLGP